MDFAYERSLLDSRTAGILDTYASRLRADLDREDREAAERAGGKAISRTREGAVVDRSATRLQAAAARLRQDAVFMEDIHSGDGKPYGALMGILKNDAPGATREDKHQWTYNNVPRLMDLLFQPGGWESYPKARRGGSGQTYWVRAKRRPSSPTPSPARAALPNPGPPYPQPPARPG